MTIVHAFDQPRVVAGQGTVGLEIARQAPATRLIVVPLGGGGLAAGVGLAAASELPDARVVGVQAEACAPYIDSLAAHRPVFARSANTICDGIAVKRPGDFTLPLVERYVDEVVTVSDDEVAQAMVLLLERSKLVVEGAGAVAVAALMAGRVALPTRARCARSSRAATWTPRSWPSASGSGRPPPVAGWCSPRSCPTGRARSRGCCGGGRPRRQRGRREHLRDGIDLHVRETAIQLVLQTRGADNSREIADAARAEGFSVRVETEKRES